MHGYFGDNLVLKNSGQYHRGDNHVAGTGDQSYYAYCVVCSSCQGEHKYVELSENNNHLATSLGWSEWSSCGANCKRTRTRTCSGGNECASSRTSDEQCQDALCDPGDFSTPYKFRKILYIDLNTKEMSMGHSVRPVIWTYWLPITY